MDQLIIDQGPYLGRIVGVGLTENSNPLILYGVSGRSEMSKQRRAYHDIHAGVVRIDSIGELTPEQEAMKNLLTYNAIRVTGELAVVSNGEQTDEIFDVSKSIGRKSLSEVLPTILCDMGVEPDRYNTPRIAGLFRGNEAYEGIVFMEEECIKTVARWPVYLCRNKVQFTSTYNGDMNNPNHPKYPYNFERMVSKTSAQELAEELYEAIDSRFVVCAATGVLKDGFWDLAVINAK